MPEREHAPVPYRRCRFDGGCCRADPVAAPASAPSGTDQQKKDQQKKEPPPHPPLGLDIESITRLPNLPRATTTTPPPAAATNRKRTNEIEQAKKEVDRPAI